MKIKNLYIKEYAGVKNRCIELEPGFNIIEGENESGKSTILSFIKFMLYGLAKRSAGETVTEKEKAFSWSGGVAEGTMTVETEDGVFRIERSAREGIRGDTLKIIELDTGDAVFRGEVPGEVFLGVSAAVFESSACVRQLSCALLDGAELGSALENLLLSADEALSTQKAVDKLESQRKKLLHKTGRGGSIAEHTLRRDTLRTRLETAKKKNAQIMDYEASYEKLAALCSEAREKLAENRELCEAYDKRQQLIRLESLKSTKARIESIETELSEYKAEKCYLGFVPRGDYLMALTEAERDFSSALKNREEKSADFEEARGALPEENEEKAKYALEIEKMGGAATVADEYSASYRRHNGLLRSAFVFLAVCAVFVAASVVCVLPLTLPKFFENAYVFPAFCAGAAIFALATIFFYIASGKKRGKCEKICRALGLDGFPSGNELYTYLGECAGAKAKCDGRRKRLEDAERALAEAESTLGSRRAELERLLFKVGAKLPENEADINGLVLEIKASSDEVCRGIDELERDLAKYRTLYEERSREAEGLDEKALRAALTPELEARLASVNITSLRREYEFMRAKAESAEQKKNYYDHELVGLRATAENPLKVETLLYATEERLREETTLHAAISLASDALQTAAVSVRKNVTPMLRARAGEILSSLTDGKYSALGISPDFTITLEADGVTRPIEAMSAGTKDAAYLALRLALISVLYRGGQPPLILDEALSQIDDRRTAALLSMLSRYCSEGNQCMLFSCHTRESEMVEANVIRLRSRDVL